MCDSQPQQMYQYQVFHVDFGGNDRVSVDIFHKIYPETVHHRLKTTGHGISNVPRLSGSPQPTSPAAEVLLTMRSYCCVERYRHDSGRQSYPERLTSSPYLTLRETSKTCNKQYAPFKAGNVNLPGNMIVMLLSAHRFHLGSKR